MVPDAAAQQPVTPRRVATPRGQERAATPLRSPAPDRPFPLRVVDRLAWAVPALLGATPSSAGDSDSGPRSFQPGELVEGVQAEYLSDTNRCWMPCVVLHVDAETGATTLSVRPNRPLDRQEQQRRLRPRTRPGRAQLEWVRAVLREGRLDEEARVVFSHHVTSLGEGAALRSEDLDAAGAELDSKLGISGSVCALRHFAQQQQLEGGGLAVEGFCEAFWDLLWSVQRDFCQALPLDAAAAPACGADPQQVYDFDKTLGQGSYGLVKLASNRATGAKCAVKIIKKKDHHVGSPQQLEVEIERLRILDHPHIVKLYEHYEDAEFVYLVMDYCSGGELLGLIKERKQQKKRLTENFVADVMGQVLRAISHVHARGLVHLDLKSANIMLMPNRRTLPPGRVMVGTTLAKVEERPHVMVIDLGVAQIFRPGDFKFNKPSGTPATMAPEVWRGEVHPKADIFSLGVVLFEMLSLSLPFNCSYDRAEAVRYWSSKPDVPWGKVKDASADAVGLCRMMLMRKRNCRPTAAQCLQSPFVSEPGCASGRGEASVPEQIVRHLASASKQSVLYKSVALSIARAWPANQLPSIKRLFHELDSAQTGRLSAEQLEAALRELGGLPPSTAHEAAEAMDLTRDGTVCWTEFVAACIDLGKGIFDQDLRQIFDEADCDGDGLLGPQDVSRLLAADHLQEETAACDVFAELAGRTGPGVRVDWPTFRKHFSAEGGAGAAGGSSFAAAAGDNPGASLAAGILEQARGLADWARAAVVPEQVPREEELQRLSEMGFADRERCAAVLRRYGNQVNHLVIEELMT